MKMALLPLDGSPPIAMDKAILFFGRGAECDIILTSSRKVSRKHCCVAQIDNRYVVRDLGSMNGVRVNDTAVQEQASIATGDVLWVGDVGFRFGPMVKAGARQQKTSKHPLPTTSGSGRPVAGDTAGRQPLPSYPSSDGPIMIPDPSVGFDAAKISDSALIPDDEMSDVNDSDIL